VTATRGTAKGPTKKPAKKAAASRSPAKKVPAKKAVPRTRKTPPPPPPPGRGDRIVDALAAASRGHGADFAGLLCVVIGLVAALGVYANAAGPAGRVTAAGVGLLIGAARVLAPVVLVVVGVLLIRGVPDTQVVDLTDDATLVDGELPAAQVGTARLLARLAFGGTLLGIAGLGLLHLARHAPAFRAGAPAMSDSAGYLGALIGVPLRAGLGAVGASLLLAALGCAGLLVITRTTIRSVVGAGAAGVAAGARPVSGAAKRAVGQLFQVGAETDVDTDTDGPTFFGPADAHDSTGPLYDQDVDAGSDAPAKVKRPRRTSVAEPDPEPPSPRTPSPRRGSSRRCRCSTPPAARRSTARPWRRPGVAWSTLWPSTAWRPAWWA
jgi:hypothetical protein